MSSLISMGAPQKDAAVGDDDDDALKIKDVYDHGAMRRMYDDATVQAVFDAGYAEDTRTIDVKITLSVCAIIVALVAHFTKNSASTRAQWVMVVAYVILGAGVSAVVAFVERDALVLTRPRNAGEAKTARPREAKNASSAASTRASHGLCVKLKCKRFDSVLSLVVTRKEDKLSRAKDALRVDVYCGDYISEDGTFHEDAYEALVWDILDAYERGKGRGSDVALDSRKLK